MNIFVVALKMEYGASDCTRASPFSASFSSAGVGGVRPSGVDSSADLERTFSTQSPVPLEVSGEVVISCVIGCKWLSSRDCR